MAGSLVRTAAAAALAALLAAVLFTPGGRDALRFRLGNYPIEQETAAVKQAVKQFSALYAGFFATAGGLEGLNAFPAEQMIKRRIFQDIRGMLDTGRILVPDRDRSEVREVRFLNLTHAAVVTDEVWYLAKEDFFTRKRMPDQKENRITVRYIMKKQYNVWLVAEYEVFGAGEQLPPLQPEVINTW